MSYSLDLREKVFLQPNVEMILPPFCFQGTCHTQLLNTWIERCLIPELQPGQVVILGHAALHKSQKPGIFSKVQDVPCFSCLLIRQNDKNLECLRVF